MKKFVIKAKSSEESTILIRKNSLASLKDHISGAPFILTDENVFRLYGSKIKNALPTAYIHTMSAGEAHKTAETLFKLLESMAGAGLTRTSTLVALGGGVIGDLGGLAANLYMRGIRFVHVPTTLLAQVDASIGGKTAIDFCGVKNLIGTFRQPNTVLIDAAFLKTLPEREFRCGLGEIIKHSALDGELFDMLAVNKDKLFDLGFLAEILPKNIAIKADIVRRDVKETGLRKQLNLGHTTAHALELSHGELSHGECVLLGIFYEAEFAKKYLDCDVEYLDSLQDLCLRVLPVHPKDIDVSTYADFARLDKKNASCDRISAVVPVRKGEVSELELPRETFRRDLAEIREALC